MCKQWRLLHLAYLHSTSSLQRKCRNARLGGRPAQLKYSANRLVNNFVITLLVVSEVSLPPRAPKYTSWNQNKMCQQLKTSLRVRVPPSLKVSYHLLKVTIIRYMSFENLQIFHSL